MGSVVVRVSMKITWVARERLEMELTTLLRSRNDVPISISLLPLLYYDKYGKTLQAERYLTENRRHGKAGYTLTKLLARMRTSIRLVERAHGQPSAEDLPKYMEYETEHGGVPIAARQIYLTFPAESTFTEQQVCNHFNGYGPVEDVRLPFHQKTVTLILFMVLAFLSNPYRDKPRLADRKKAEKKHPIYFGLQFFDGDSDTQPLFRTFNDTRHVRKEHEVELEIERRRLSEFQLVPKRNGMATQYPDSSSKKLMVKKQSSKTRKGSVSCLTLSDTDPPAKKEPGA